jgi:hypothetical protein
MALKNFDAKQFLLEKGERVGLYAAAGVMALFLVLGLKNVFTSSAGKNERDLKELISQTKNKISSSQPTPEEFKEIATPDQRLEQAMSFAEVRAEKFPNTVAYFEGEAAAENLRRAPRVKVPVEFLVAVARAQVDTYRLSGDREHILVLRGAATDKNTMKTNQKISNFFTGAGRRMAMGMAGPGPVGGGSMGGPPMPMGGGSPMQRPAGTQGTQGGRPGLMDQSDPDSKRNAQMVKIDDLEKMQDAKPAEDVRPVRMAIIVGSFPYKEQLEEFRQTLHYGSLAELLSDPNSTPQFKGVEVERAEIKPGDTEDKLTWKPLTMNDFTQLILDAGRRWEDDAPELDPVIVDGLTMRRPLQVPGRQGLYPTIETNLKHIETTLADLKKAQQGTIAKPKNRFKDASDLDIFSKGDSADVGGPPGMAGAAVGDTGARRPMGVPMPAAGDTPGYDASAQLVVPEYLLMRFLDVTIEPGKAYRYRFRLRMANPNYGRKDVAWASLATDKEIKSDTVMVDQTIQVPPELFYYAVDMKTATGLDSQDDKDVQKQLWNDPNPTTNQMAAQAHRWVENVYPDDKRPRDGYAVGDWCIAERMLLTRGEYLGKRVTVEVPIWDVLSERFSLASLTVSGRKNKQKVPVFFGPEGQSDSVLVDFQGGMLDYNKIVGMEEDRPKYTPVHDKAPVEMLTMSADGRLSAHRGDADMKDDQRRARVDTWRSRIKEIKDKDKARTPQQGTPMNPFNNNN